MTAREARRARIAEQVAFVAAGTVAAIGLALFTIGLLVVSWGS